MQRAERECCSAEYGDEVFWLEHAAPVDATEENLARLLEVGEGCHDYRAAVVLIADLGILQEGRALASRRSDG
jgi:hypothetical protein